MNTSKPTKDKLSAALLAFFVGTFGLHKFYLGKTGMGITYIAITFLSMFLLSPIIAIISFYEGIRYLLQSDEEFDRIQNADKEFEVQTNEPNKHVAGLLALSLGILGVHKFYVRQAKWGMIYLCFGFLIPILICVPVLILSIILLIVGSESGNDGMAITAFILYITSYLGIIFLVTGAQFIAMLEGIITLFKSQESFEQSLQ